MAGTIKIEGLDLLKKKLKDNVQLDDVKRVVKQNGVELEARMKRNAVFVKGYQTGTTKRSIRSSYQDSGLTVTVQPTTEYASYLEHGTRFMDAQPFVKPSFNAQKEIFKHDLSKLMK